MNELYSHIYTKLFCFKYEHSAANLFEENLLVFYLFNYGKRLQFNAFVPDFFAPALEFLFNYNTDTQQFSLCLTDEIGKA